MILQSAKHLYLLLKLGNWGTRGFSWSLPSNEKYSNNIRFVFPIYYAIEHVMSLNELDARKKGGAGGGQKITYHFRRGFFLFFPKPELG